MDALVLKTGHVCTHAHTRTTPSPVSLGDSGTYAHAHTRTHRAELEAYATALERSGRKDQTIDAVARGCRKCIAALDSISPGWTMDALDDDAVHAVRRELESELRESTLRNYLTSFGGFVEWHIGRDPVKHARLLWNGRADTERVWITPEDYRKLYAVADPRERVLLALGATMGLRREEMMTLSLDQLRDGGIEIHGKGHGLTGKVEWRPMSESVRRAIAEYMPWRSRHIGAVDPGTLIITARGDSMGKTEAKPILDALGSRAGIKVTPHSLRRLYAMTMADAGVPLETMARMMRHSSPTTTMTYYLKADPRRMAGAMEAVDEALRVRCKLPA